MLQVSMAAQKKIQPCCIWLLQVQKELLVDFLSKQSRCKCREAGNITVMVAVVSKRNRFF